MSEPSPTNINKVLSPVHSVSVRRLVEFVLREGDLSSGERAPRKIRARQGSDGHRKLQKSRPADYQTEVAISCDVSAERFVLRILGRIDGMWKRAEGPLLEEIKTVKSSWNREPGLLHWAQLKVYGSVVCQQQQLTEIDLQLTYLELPLEQITVFRERFTATQLGEFFQFVVSDYRRWLEEQENWKAIRNASIEKLAFPYGEFREGQRPLSAAVYKSILNSQKLFIEAPTGIGKTMAVLFPAAKVMTARAIDKIFYLTAKTVTQSLAEKTFDDLKMAGLRFRTITLTAKDKVCQRDGKPCNILECPLAKGYYDRLKPALRAALKCETLNRARIEAFAQEYQVCPHEFSLDLSEWGDAIICDYNHAFDPRASLKRHFGEEGGSNVLLIDEAHNLLERARDMFSATLHVRDLAEARKNLDDGLSRCANAIRRFEKQVWELVQDVSLPIIGDEVPSELLKPLDSFAAAAEKYFAENDEVNESLLDLYYTITSFLQIAEGFNERYRFIIDEEFGSLRVRLFCLDPSQLLAEVFAEVESSILFSATLTPLDYFREALGGDKEDRLLKLKSPFPPQHLKVLTAPYVATSYRHRASSLGQVAEAIETFVGVRRGNYLVYFPSYKYLNEVLPKLQTALTDAEILVQRTEMRDAERLAFVEAFKVERSRSLIGLAVMGGVFGEGIDLIGERLIGAVIVGVGLPQLCLERNLIRQHFDGQGMDGFAYGYVFPGFNRVLQAVGRVIRSEKDKGAVLLIDSRFQEERFRELFPAWWRVTDCEDNEELKRETERFWAT